MNPEAKLRATIVKALDEYYREVANEEALDPIDDPRLPYLKGCTTNRDIAEAFRANGSKDAPTDGSLFIHFFDLSVEGRAECFDGLLSTFLGGVRYVVEIYVKDAQKNRELLRVNRSRG